MYSSLFGERMFLVKRAYEEAFLGLREVKDMEKTGVRLVSAKFVLGKHFERQTPDSVFYFVNLAVSSFSL